MRHELKKPSATHMTVHCDLLPILSRPGPSPATLPPSEQPGGRGRRFTLPLAGWSCHSGIWLYNIKIYNIPYGQSSEKLHVTLSSDIFNIN